MRWVIWGCIHDMAASTQCFCDLSGKTCMRSGMIRIETILHVFSIDLHLSVEILQVYRTDIIPYGVSKLLVVYQHLTKTQRNNRMRQIKTHTRARLVYSFTSTTDYKLIIPPGGCPAGLHLNPLRRGQACNETVIVVYN